MNTPEDKLMAKIRSRGPISFEEFMTEALYGEAGFYRTRVPGDGTTYETSPTLTPWFGRLVARQLEVLWESCSRPAKFTVVEIGPGRGDLARDALSIAKGEFGASLRWILVEPFNKGREHQQSRIKDSRASWKASLENVEVPITGVIFANEVLDNFPFAVFEVRDARAHEVFVEERGGGFAEILVPSSQTIPPGLEDGDRFEVSEHQAQWIGRANEKLKMGYLLLIDYGDAEPQIHTTRPSGTALAYRSGDIHTDLLAGVGNSDITAHVNFTRLAVEAVCCGLTTGRLRSQSEWLRSLGLNKIHADLRLKEKTVAVIGERSALGVLTSGRLGDLRVFLAAKGVAIAPGWD